MIVYVISINDLVGFLGKKIISIFLSFYIHTINLKIQNAVKVAVIWMCMLDCLYFFRVRVRVRVRVRFKVKVCRLD